MYKIDELKFHTHPTNKCFKKIRWIFLQKKLSYNWYIKSNMTRKIYSVAFCYFQGLYWGMGFIEQWVFITVIAAVFYHDTIICYRTVEIHQALQIHDNVNKLLTLNTKRVLSFFWSKLFHFAIILQNPYRKSIMHANCCGAGVLHLQCLIEINLIEQI